MTYFYTDKNGEIQSATARSTTEAIEKCRNLGVTFNGVSSYPIYIIDNRP